MSEDTALTVIKVALILPFLVVGIRGRWLEAIIGYTLSYVSLTVFDPLVGILVVVFVGTAIYRSFGWATPDSLWAKSFYDEEQMEKAAEHHAPSDNENSEGENSTE